MANPFDQFDGAHPYTVPLGPRDPYKAAAEARAQEAEARANRADARAAAAAAREDQKFQQEQGGLTPPGDLTKTGDDYLRTLPAGMAAQVRAIADGRRAIPSSTRNKEMMTLLAAASQYDPTLDAANAATRVATRKKFTSGTTRDNITAINTALGHLGSLWKDAQGLDNRGLPLWNTLANAAESASGDPRVSKFNMTRHAVVDELEKAFRGSGGTQAGIEEWSKGINSSQSPEQLRAAVGKAVELLSSRLDALNDSYTQGMGHSADPMTFLNPHAQKVFSALGPGGDGNIPDEPKGGAGTPPILGGDTPPPGPDMTAATGDTKTEVIRGPVEKKLSAMLASGASSGTIRAFAKANNYPAGKVDGVLAWRAMNPTYKGGYDVHQENIVPTTAYNRAAAHPVAAGLLAAADAGTAGLVDEATGAVNTLKNGGSLSDNIAAADYAKQMEASANPNASLAGSVAGGAGAMIGGGLGLRALLAGGAKGGVGRNVLAWAARNPIKAAAAGDTAYGTAYGAGENNDNRALGAGVGGVTGLIASPIGSVGTRMAGTALRGVTDPAVQRLRAAGIPLTAGEVLGGGWKKAQDAMTSVFGPGNMVARRYVDGRRALNEAAFNQAGDVIDTPINAVGQQGIEALNTAKNQAYSQALDPVTLDLNNPQTLGAINAARVQGAAIPNVDQASDIATGAIDNYIGNAAPNGIMSGRDFQQAYRGLARTGRTAASRMYGHEIGQTLGRGQDALVDTLETQHPGAYDGFLRANSANRHLNILADAVNAAKNQVDGGEVLFTPAQLGTAATGNAKTFSGKIAAASGNRPFNNLAADAQQVMSSKLPDSGTPMRLAMTALATGGAGGTGYGIGGGEGAAEGGVGTLGLLTLLGTRRGQQLLTAVLANRTVADQLTGRALRRAPTVGGDLLASAGIPILDSPSR
jgi:hypothetical protein